MFKRQSNTKDGAKILYSNIIEWKTVVVVCLNATPFR